eukprot:TRINITY_DN5063_c0_g1_i1.p1 TRINITY_DN5063_c0_g1~~TRINITY_DN5063_c0_g1_i1.p1  ORF type:complete len:118 (-),score=2.42 TRINITY_DN5063_c0_g1_i1:194-547(-)
MQAIAGKSNGSWVNFNSCRLFFPPGATVRPMHLLCILTIVGSARRAFDKKSPQKASANKPSRLPAFFRFCLSLFLPPPFFFPFFPSSFPAEVPSFLIPFVSLSLSVVAAAAVVVVPA